MLQLRVRSLVEVPFRWQLKRLMHCAAAPKLDRRRLRRPAGDARAALPLRLLIEHTAWYQPQRSAVEMWWGVSNKVPWEAHQRYDSEMRYHWSCNVERLQRQTVAG